MVHCAPIVAQLAAATRREWRCRDVELDFLILHADFDDRVLTVAIT